MFSIAKRFVFLVALSACASGPDETAVGQLDVALVATGSDGATYRLPAGTTLTLHGASFDDSIELDGEEATVSAIVLAGEYTAQLAYAELDGTGWPLVRTDGGGSEAVMATLLTPTPMALSVVEGQHTPVVLAFRVARGGVVTFSQGTLDVSVDVTTTEAQRGRLAIDAEVAATSADWFEGAPAIAMGRLPGAGATGEIDQLTVRITGPWEQRSRSYACAPLSFSDVTLGGHPGFQDLIIETMGGAGEVCATPDNVRVVVSRWGAPGTSTFGDLGDPSMFFRALVVVDVPGVFDGEKVDLGAFAGAHDAPTYVGLLAGGEMGSGWYSASFFGQAHLTFVPQE